MHSSEYIRPAEFFTPDMEHVNTPVHTLSRDEAARIAGSRARALEQLAPEIAAPLVEAIRRKITYESAKLRDIAETEVQRARESDRLRTRLPSEYFSLKPLEADLL